jgi:Zn-dependent protease with chaperone function
MHHGFQSISDFSFLTVGFVVVAIGAMGFIGSFILGPRRGGHVALAFSRIWAVLTGVSLILTIAYAMISNQWTPFLERYGFSPLIQMGVLAFGWIFIMWFMATQYAVGRITLDEKFGGSKQRRKEAIEQAKDAQYEAYHTAHPLGDDEQLLAEAQRSTPSDPEKR